MKSCCSEKAKEMQDVVVLGKWLTLFLAASPFVLLIPDFAPPGNAGEAAKALAEKMAVMTAEKALSNVNSGMAKPDFANAIQAVDKIVLGKLNGIAGVHMLRHQGTERAVWDKLRLAYDPTQQNGSSGGGGWFSWW